ncbi:Chemotaxis protein CheA [Gemmata sp. SH-PL17]|uniref:hybrid sensor histidine kinase/response regulator n=1 Tax=Gemmata sp. SH-PL17 TaxID=1630693 RepID=UPI0004B30CEF|nr:hybrid sensor histidine kinase/response regulator [Gemmata sp. SH-PL17]AMV24957.1 Chemotaxis protein CheA [Gemmata sp. SH-PL17]
MISTNPELLNEFVGESREHLTTVAEELLALEKASGADRQQRLDRLFRAVHSVKGSAGLVGCHQIADLAHSLETIFDRARQGTLAQTAHLTDGLLTGADLIRALLDDAANSNDVDIGDAIARLEGLLTESPAPHSEVAVAHALRVDLDAYVRRTGHSLTRFFADLEANGLVREPRLVLPEHDISKGLPDGPVSYECQYTSMVPLERLAEQLRLQLTEFNAAVPEPPEPKPAAPEPPEPEPPAAEDTEPPVIARAEPASRPEAERPSSVRISVQILDRLMNLAGELVLVRNQAMQAADPTDAQMRQIVQRLNGVTTDVQQVVMLTRMQPVGNLFSKFSRLVRDVSRKLGKQIELTTRGTEVELDKAILEELADPLTHLVRNCCDHGIEKPAERIAAGKVPQGHVLLHAHHEGGQIRIEVRDDGRGIDPQRVRRKALERGLKSAAELGILSDTELQALVLLPGFSTADDVTELSGRGVGMDVVRTNIEHLGGNLQIESVPGRGTCMHLRLPLTLAIIPCLTVVVGDQRYAIAQKDLEELVCLNGRAGSGKVEHTHDQEVYRLRGRLLPLVRLGEVLARPEPFTAATRAEVLHRHRDQAPGLTYIAVVKVGSERFGLVVDRLLNTEEIVVKSIHPLLKPLRCYSGSTIMGDGRVALILDIEGIARHAGVSFESARQTVAVRGAGETESQTVLLFQYGPREQFAIPVVMIRRIEEIRVSGIERVGDREFWNLHGQAVRVLRLDNYLKVSPPVESDTMYLLLPKNVRQPMGILLSRILDTQSLAIQIDTESHHQDGLMGTAIIHNRMTLFPHLYRLGERMEADDLAASETRTRKAPSRRKRILLVEDTQFFRQVVKNTLEDEGYEVFTAVNGALGLREISQNQYDLVVSDINMPEMDGWDMARAVREQLGNHDLPMLALTTLNSDRDRNRALESGFNAHEVKLSRESFLATVARLLAPGAGPAAGEEGKHG